MNRLLALLGTAVALGSIVAGYQSFGPWVLATLPAAAGVALFLVARASEPDREAGLARHPKGTPLRNARVELAQLRAVEAPIPPSWDLGAPEDPGSDRRFFWLDVTITPRDIDPTAPRGWDPDDLALASLSFDPRRHEAGADDSCEVRQVQILENGVARSAGGRTVAGAQRLLLGVGVRAAVTELKLVYHEESFGLVTLPAPSARQAARARAQEAAGGSSAGAAAAGAGPGTTVKSTSDFMPLAASTS